MSWLAERLGDERTRLGKFKDENLEMRASFGLSYGDLDPPVARMFRRLGLIPGPDFAPGVAGALIENTSEEAMPCSAMIFT